MTRNGADSDKTAGFNEKPVTVALNGNQIEATHHITTGDNRLLHLYIDARDGGIDVTVPLCSDKPAYAHSDRGERALGLNGDEDEPELVTDGGRDAVKFARDVDYVEYDGDGYLVYGAVTREELEICQVNRRPITVPLDECTPTDVWGTPVEDDDDDDDEPRLVTDGGYSTPYLHDPWAHEGVGLGDMRDHAVEPVTCGNDGCDNDMLPEDNVCSECYVDPRVEAEQCDAPGCDRRKGDYRDSYCGECLDDMHGEDDDVTPCVNPACDCFTQPGTDVCGSRCAELLHFARRRLDGATWWDLQVGSRDRPDVEDVLDANRENGGGDL